MTRCEGSDGRRIDAAAQEDADRNIVAPSFDARLTRQVPVQPRVVGTFAPGYTIERVVVDPAVITISGPKKHVEAVESAITDPIDVSGAMSQLTVRRHPYVSDPLIQVASADPVRVTIIMQKVSGTSGSAATKPE